MPLKLLHSYTFKPLLAVFLLLSVTLAPFKPLNFYSFKTNVAHASTIAKPANYLTTGSGLIGWWNFDGPNMVQNVADASGSGNTGYLSGQTSTTSVIGKFGQGLSFDGSDDFVNIPTISIANAVTVSAWVYLDASQQGFILAKNPVNTDWELYYDSITDSGFIWRGGGGAPQLHETSPSSIKTWHHVVGTQSGTNAVLYVDGVAIDSSASIPAIGNGSGTVNIGRFTSGFYFKGIIDDVRLYNRMLSAQEVRGLYSMGAAGKIAASAPTGGALSAGLVGYWTFDGPNMTTNVRDSSGQGKTAYLFGQTSTTTVLGKIGQALSFDGVNDYVGGGSSDTVAPSFIQESEMTSWNSWEDQSTTFAVNSGDVLVALGGCENAGGAIAIAGGGFTWAQSELEDGGGVNTLPWTAIWTTTATEASSSLRVSLDNNNNNWHCGANVLTFRGSSGIGNTNSTNNGTGSGAPSLSLTTSAANSAIAMITNDWNATAGARTYVTADAGTFTEQTHDGAAGSTYIVNVGYYANVGTAAAKTIGISSPATQRYDILAVEVKGTASGSSLSISGVKTVSFWAKPNSLTQSIIDMDGSKNIALSSGTAQANNFTGATIYIDGVQTTTFPDTGWHFVTVTTNTAVDATAFVIGKVSSTYYAGLLDDVRTYTKVLSLNEIKALYTMGAAQKISASPSTGLGLSSGLVGYWTFDGPDMTSNVRDRSGLGNHGNLVHEGSGTTTAIGKIGQGLSFDGVDDYIFSTTQYVDPQVFSVSIWFKTTIASGHKLIGFEDVRTGTLGNSYDRQIWMGTNGKIYFGWYSNTREEVVSLGTLNDGQWHHAVGIHDSSPLGTLYIDGVSQGTDTGVAQTYTGYWRIGSYLLNTWTNAADGYFTGTLDDVRIYNRALSANEVIQLYNLSR